MYRVLIVEDELIIAESIAAMLSDLGHRVVHIASSFDEAAECLTAHNFDLALLDINLEDGREGIEIGHQLNEQNIPFVYVTSYADKETLLNAKQTLPGSYIIKPVSSKELYAAIEIAMMHHRLESPQELTIKEGNIYKKVLVSDILYLEADNVYTKVITNDRVFLQRSTIRSFLEQLPENQFYQVHRSFVVNLSRIDSIKSSGVMIGKTEVPISRSYRTGFMEKIGLS